MRGDAIGIWSLISLLLILLPIALVLYFGFVVYRSPQGYSPAVFHSIALTLFSAALSALLVFVIFTPLSYVLSRSSGRMAEAISDIPASIPHPIVGIAFLILGSPITPFGRFLTEHGLGFYDSLFGLVLVLSFISAPIYIRSAQSLFTSLNREPEQFASTLGKGRSAILYGLLIPSNARGLLSASLTSMSRAISEFGSVAILVFYISGGLFSGTETASVLIYQYYGYYGPGPAITASAILIVISVAVLLAVKFLSHGRTITEKVIRA